MFGIDNGWWGTLLGVPAFNAAFGTKQTVGADGSITVSLSASEQSAGTSLGMAGIMIGCALATPIGRCGGRRLGVKLMAVIALVGIVIQITASVNGYRYWQLVAGKIVNSISMGIAANVIPTYQSELAPAKYRGAVVNLYQTIQIVGVIISTIAVYKLNTRTDDLSWQLCIGLQFVAPTLLLCGVWFMPESPRYLVFSGRNDEARQVLEYLNAGIEGYSAEEEVAALHAAFEHEKSLQKPSVFALFKGSDRRRALIAIGVMCLQQAQGSSYMTSYIVLFLMALGMTDVFKVVMALYCLYLAAILCSFYLPDRFGRRPLLMYGALACAVCLTITCAINVGYGDAITQSAQKAALAMVFIWYFCFGLVWSPLVWITCSEICSARAREPTLSVATFSAFGTSLIITLVAPYIQDPGYGNIGASIGFIWAAFTWASIPFVYFFVPEMKGLTLEQIDELFDAETPTRKFGAAPLFLEYDGGAHGSSSGQGSLKGEDK
ncbi:proteinral substrate transporter [Rhodotorula kratochvilovae]